MSSKRICVSIILVCNMCISMCQTKSGFYLHFRDTNSDVFYLSDTTFDKSIDSSFFSNDTLFVVLKSPVMVKTNNKEYSYAFRKGRNRYIERYSLADTCSPPNISYIIIKNYYCIRVFKHKRQNHYIQVSSDIFSEPFLY